MLDILYSDRHIVVCIKPVGVSSQDDGENSMVALLKRSENTHTIYPVHRLDRDVSGLMVYAKTKKAAADLSAQVQDGTFKKEYTTVVNGVPDVPEGELVDLLFHDRIKNKSYVVKRSRKGVREAILNYKVLKVGEIDGKPVSLVDIALVTGRTHQIRVQFSSRNMPLLGDKKYGGGNLCPIALMSTHLSFAHPTSGENIDFCIAVPNTFPWDIFGI